MTEAADIIVIDGSEEQLEKLRNAAMETGELIELNQELLRDVIYTEAISMMWQESKDVPLSVLKKKKMQAAPITGWHLRK